MEKFLIRRSEQMRAVLERLSSSVNTLAVVDDSGLCLGTITDGDVRMALLNGQELDTKVDVIMNPTPMTASTADSAKELSAKLERIGRYGLPVVDDTGRLIDILFHDATGGATPRICTNVCSLILAGGLGARLRPYTETVPKPLLKIGSKSILEKIVELHRLSGITKIFLSVNYLGHQVEEMFGDGEDFGVSIEYVREQERLGTAGPLALIKDQVSNFDQVMVMNGDLVTNVDLGSMLAEHRIQQSNLTVGIVQKEFENPFGVVTVSSAGEIIEIHEKPIYKEFVSAGIYCLEKSTLNHVPEESMDMPDLIRILIDNRKKVTAFSIFETWDDVGFPSDLERLRLRKPD